jgi:Mg-chelatase subunit ChlD
MQYATGFLSTLFIVVGSGYYFFFYQPANCFDLQPNGNETGVDCGGDCVRICTAEVIPPRIVWAESFKINDGQYNTVAYVENNNELASTPVLKYTFELLDGDTVVATRSGETVLPPNSVYPIFEGRIFTDAKQVTETRLTLESSDLWLPAKVGRAQFKTTDVLLSGADTRPRLDVAIENTELTPAENIEIVATLFNDAGEPVTASQTFIDKLEARSSKDVVFTWPSSIAKTVRSCIVPSDVIVGIDLSGSMNNDGGAPPEPVTSALRAAQDFVARFNKNDQAAVVTFATQASMVATLSGDHIKTAALIKNLSIDSSEELGYTNTPAALRVAAEELASERHSGNARRVLVLLTDGLPTAKGEEKNIIEEAKKAAAELTASGVEVYAIGLGKNVNHDFISALATSNKNAFIAPTGSELSSIYAEITSSLCESGATRIDVIAKTPTNFTPLR